MTPLTIVTGQNFVYNLNVTNNGPDDAQNVVLTENLPPSASFLSASPAPTTSVSNVLTFNLGTIPSGQTVTVKLTMSPLTNVGNYVHNSASVTTTSIDTNTANNSSTHGLGGRVAGSIRRERDHRWPHVFRVHHGHRLHGHDHEQRTAYRRQRRLQRRRHGARHHRHA